MISRVNTVNLSNMPVVTEKVGPDSTDDSLVSSLAALSIGEINDQWKITRFEKSPPVRIILLSIALSDIHQDVHLSRCLC